jgi:nickel-dependent lactate racemase
MVELVKSPQSEEAIGFGWADKHLTYDQLEAIIDEGLSRLPLAGQRLLVIIPDRTRTMPMPLFFRLLARHLTGKVKDLAFLVALGTHPPLSDQGLMHLVGVTPDDKQRLYPDVRLINHAWDDPQALTTVGLISASEMKDITDGLLVRDVPVRLNRLVLDYDHLLICGPVFPHEIVGFSGGNKYFFPGIAGPEIIDFTHWLAALITTHAIIGLKENSVRQVIDRAAQDIPRPRHALCAVVDPDGVYGAYIGSPEDAFSCAADLSSQVHIQRVDKPFRQVLSVLPEMYGELWVGAKGMYKVEPAVVDGGEIILYAPHITEISVTHGKAILQVGYHVRDYFLKQWERYERFPWKVLAHSTQLKGTGMFENGLESSRVQVTLATGIPERICAQVNLGYRDPASIYPQAWARQEERGILVVPHAGERLYRLKGD